VDVVVEVLFSVGTIVHVGVGLGVVDRLQAANIYTVNNIKTNGLNLALICNSIQGCNGKKGIMIADFPLRDSKGVISITD
jgi:hypothetical protein